MHKTRDRKVEKPQGRVLARLLADELMNVPSGGLGPTTVVTGPNSDITNQTGDNDGPHVPPSV